MQKLFICILFFASSSIYAQKTPEIKNLVFEGAGIRGIAYCGAITELEKNNMVAGVERVGGTSAGAIIALTLSLGYSGAEIAQIISSTDFRKFNDGRYLFPGGINRLNRSFGWYRGHQFEKWIEKIIKDKTGDADINFLRLKELGFRELYITATCLNKQKLVILSHETYPEMKLKDAVRISMSIPLYFQAVFIDEKGRVFRERTEKPNLDVMIDGGITGNFPIRMFDSTRYISIVITNQFTYNPHTLAFRIDSDEHIIYDQSGNSIAPLTLNNIKVYIEALYNMVLENLNRQALAAEDWKRTISISDGKLGPRIRKMPKQEVQLLISNGQHATFQYFRSAN
jgi:NTE family protein